MSEKEKAVELIEKFKNYVHGYIGSSMLTNTEYPEQILAQAKAVAEITVDEILNFMKLEDDDSGTCCNANSKWINYWIGVKREIYNL